MRQEHLGDASGGSDSDERSSADDSSEDLLGANYTGPLGAAMKWKRQCAKGEADDLGAAAYCYLHSMHRTCVYIQRGTACLGTGNDNLAVHCSTLNFIHTYSTTWSSVSATTGMDWS